MSGFSDPDDSESDKEDWAQTLDERLPSNKTQGSLLKPQNTLVQDKPTRCPHSRVIIHIDIDCFYAQVEMVRNPSLCDKPLGIQQKNIIVTCNYVARARGLTKLMYLKEAQEKCPDLVIVKGEDLTHYRQMSYKVTELFLKYSPLVERLGMDENYVDATNMVASDEWRHMSDFPGYQYGSEDSSEKDVHCSCEERLRIGAHISKFLRDQLFAEFGLTSCGGVAHNKLLAKLVGSTHKPNKQTWLPAQHATKLLLSLGECRKIPSIGRSIATKLASLGVTSVSDLQASSAADLEEELGSRIARLVCDLSSGVDDSEVTATGRPQTMSDEDSFKKCSDLGDARSRTEGLIRSLLVRVYEDGRVPQTLRLTVRNTAYHRVSRQCALPTTVTTKIRQGDTEGAVAGLLQVCMDLLGKLVDIKSPFHLTLINVAVCKLVDHSATSRGISAFLTKPTMATPCGQGQNQEGVSDRRGITADKTSMLDTVGKETTVCGTGTGSFIHESIGSSCDSNQNLTSRCIASEIGSTMIGSTSNRSEKSTDSRATGITGQSTATLGQPKCGTKRPLEDVGDKLEGTALKRSFFKEVQLSSQTAKFASPQTDLFKKTKTNNELDSAEVSGSEDVQCTAGPVRPPGEGTVNHTEPLPGGVSMEGRPMPPPGVDPGVFFSLPLDVQLDVVKQYKDNNLQKTMPHSEANNQSAELDLQGSTGSSQTHSRSLGMKEKQVASTATPKKSIKSFFNKRSSLEGEATDSTNMGNMGNKGYSSPECYSKHVSTSDLESGSNHDDKVKTPGPQSGGVGLGVDIPDHMDRDVFLGLPREIQEELRADWRRRLVNKAGTSIPGGATSSGKKPLGKKLGSQGQGSLERFFKKK